MKKIIFLFVLVAAAGAVVWAQQVSLDDVNSASDFLIDWNFNAVQTESVESRFSVQRFTSDVDDFIDTRLYNPAIGAFVFVGGHPTDVTPTVSFGFGKTIGSAYLGIYYGGSLVTGGGDKIENNDIITTTSNADWNNNLAILLGIAGMGFRLDLITGKGMAGDTFRREDYDGVLTGKETNGETSVALGWGAMFGDHNLAPWLRVGYKFPKTVTTSNSSNNTTAPTYRMTDTDKSLLGLQAGALFGLSDTDSLVVEVNYTMQFAREYKGDTKYLMGTVGIPDGPDPYEEGGSWGANLSAYYQRDIAFGKIPGLTLRIKPRLEADFVSVSQSSTKTGAPELPTANWLTLGAGFDVGAEYRYEKIGLYTGFCLDIIEWTNLSRSGGDDANKKNDSRWVISSLVWKDPILEGTMSSPVLKFGVTFTPIKGLVIGAGLDAAMGKLFDLNLSNLQISNVDNINANEKTNGMFSSSFQVTVSYQF